MPPLTTTADIPYPVRVFYDRVLLRRALPFLAYTLFGQRRPLAARSGDQIKFRRYLSLGTQTTPLTEGVTPTAQKLAVTDVIATIEQYGGYVEITDKIELTHQDPVLTEAVELLGEQAGQTLDIICRNVLMTGTNVMYSTGTSRAAVVDLISAALLDKAIRILNNLNATRITEIVPATTGVGTVPIPPAYFAIVHPDVAFDLQRIPGFVPAHQYAQHTAIQNGEIGAYKDIRFIMTTHGAIWAGAGAATTAVKNTGGKADVYGTIILAKDAYGIIPLEGESLRTIIKPRGSAGTADPLDQRATAGWVAWQTYKILNDDFILRIESAASL